TGGDQSAGPGHVRAEEVVLDPVVVPAASDIDAIAGNQIAADQIRCSPIVIREENPVRGAPEGVSCDVGDACTGDVRADEIALDGIASAGEVNAGLISTSSVARDEVAGPEGGSADRGVGRVGAKDAVVLVAQSPAEAVHRGGAGAVRADEVPSHHGSA